MNIVKCRGNDLGFPYIAFEPENFGERPAVIFQLHGAGERAFGGDDLEKVLIHGFPNTVTDENLKNCILVMPQCPPDSFWIAKCESLKAFMDKIVEKYDADTSRIYVCGLSMGGYGTWYTAMAYPDLFAAIAPCCGGGMAWNAGVLKMPVWAFHGLNDNVVSPRNTIEMVEKLKETNENLKYDLFEGVYHDSWTRAFTTDTLNWLLEQRK